MTYNVEMKYDEDDGGWEGRDPALAIQSIINADPDIVGVQEDNDGWNSYLAGLTSKGYTRYHTAGNGTEYLDILYKTDRFTKITSGLKFYKKIADVYTNVPTNGADMSIDTSGEAGGIFGWGEDKGRMFSYVVLQDKTTGAKVLVVNTHLHYGSTASDATEHHLLREYQARLLRAWLDEMKAQYPNQIVMGDLNADPAASGKAAVEELTKDDGLELSKHSAMLKGDNGGTLASTSSYDRRDSYVFDHILARNMTAVEYYVVNNMIDVDNTRYPSDHLPVVARFVCSAE